MIAGAEFAFAHCIKIDKLRSSFVFFFEDGDSVGEGDCSANEAIPEGSAFGDLGFALRASEKGMATTICIVTNIWETRKLKWI